MKKITIFTATFNRRKTLPQLYYSLLNQSNKNFEWLIVDDGSIDDTEDYIENLKKDSTILIRYYKQSNKGKYIAHNKGASLAEGELFFCVDSDDYLVPDAIQIIFDNIKNLKTTDCGFIAGKVDQNGTALSFGINSEIPHMGLYRLKKLGVYGEFSLIFKTDFLKENYFPEIKSEKFMGESVLYDKLELKGLNFCPISQNITVCQYQNDGLTSDFRNIMLKNPIGYKIYYIQRIDLASNLKERVGFCLRYYAFYFLSKDKKYRYKGKHKLLLLCCLIPGFLTFLYYKLI